MIRIEINEESGSLVVNGSALLLLTDKEYAYLKDLGQSLKARVGRGEENEYKE